MNRRVLRLKERPLRAGCCWQTRYAELGGCVEGGARYVGDSQDTKRCSKFDGRSRQQGPWLSVLAASAEPRLYVVEGKRFIGRTAPPATCLNVR